MFFLVTGASGVGKTTVRKLIESKLAGRFRCCELGSLGLTTRWTLEWRHKAVERAVQMAVQEQESGRHFLLCGDPVPPGELYATPSAGKLEGIQVCLLDVSADKQTERLAARGDAPDLIPRHVAFADWMRRHALDHRYRPDVIMNGGWDHMRWEVWNAEQVTAVPWKARIIDTSLLDSVQVAEAVYSWINSFRGL